MTQLVPNGLYHYKMPDWKRPVRVEVKDGRVRFNRNTIPIAFSEIPVMATFEPLTLDDIPLHHQAFIITVDGTYGVTIDLPDPIPATPSRILDAYAKEYAIPRDKLGYTITRYIPMPNVD